mgnify:CR=1 FL=1
MKFKKNFKFVIAADGSAASGKTTGSKKISKKFGLNFLSSGLLYRYASYQILKHKPQNKISFLKRSFSSLKLKKLNKLKLHTPEISNHTSLIAKEKKIRTILKLYQKKFAKKYKRVCIEGRDIGSVILPKADIKFFFTCSLDVAARRRFAELRKGNKEIRLSDVKKSLKIRNYRDKNRKNSPLIQAKDAVIVRTDKLNKSRMINYLSNVIKEKLKNKYGSRS